MLSSSLCCYGHEYILVKGTITVGKNVGQCQPNNPENKKVIFENCAPFTNCISRRINTQIDDAHDIDVAMLICNLIEYSDNYSKTSENLRQY